MSRYGDRASEEQLVHIGVDLWGASVDWIEAIAQGASRRGADEVDTTICPAYVGINLTVPVDKVAGVRQYIKQCLNLVRFAA